MKRKKTTKRRVRLEPSFTYALPWSARRAKPAEVIGLVVACW